MSAIRRSVALLLAVALPMPVSAQVWHFGFDIRSVRRNASYGLVTFRTWQPAVNPANCSSTDFYGIEEADYAESALAILLTALTADRKVDILVDDTGCSTSGRIRVYDVRIN